MYGGKRPLIVFHSCSLYNFLCASHSASGALAAHPATEKSEPIPTYSGPTSFATWSKWFNKSSSVERGLSLTNQLKQVSPMTPPFLARARIWSSVLLRG